MPGKSIIKKLKITEVRQIHMLVFWITLLLFLPALICFLLDL